MQLSKISGVYSSSSVCLVSMYVYLLWISAELMQLTQEYSIRTQLEVFRKDKTSKEEQIRRLWVFL